MDRWVEIDIDWFGDPPWDGPIRRVRRAHRAAARRRRPGAPRRLLQHRLAGRPRDRVDRPARAAAAAPLATLRPLGGADATRDLRDFLDAAARRSAAAAGVADLRLGVLVAGPRRGRGAARHGERCTTCTPTGTIDILSCTRSTSPRCPGPDLDPRVPHARGRPSVCDPARTASGPRASPSPSSSAPSGVPSQAILGLDLIHLRDGFLGPLLYTRVGPYGTVASDDPDENRTWTDAVARLFRACKEARPDGARDGLLERASAAPPSGCPAASTSRPSSPTARSTSSSTRPGVAPGRTGGTTLEGLDVPATPTCSATAPRSAAATQPGRARRPPCRQYNLIETWDGWEPWDTLHDMPGKLEWAMLGVLACRRPRRRRGAASSRRAATSAG